MSDEGAAPERATREDTERFARRLFQQWSHLREERQAQLAAPVPPVVAGRPDVPWGVELAAAWAWRFLVIGAAGYVLFRVLGFLGVVVVPLVVALLIAALTAPLVNILGRAGVRRGLAAVLVVVGGIVFIAALLTFAGHQVVSGAQDLADQTVQGLDEIKDWLKTGPLHASESQINDYIDKVQKAISKGSSDGKVLGHVTEVGTAITHVFAGLFIVLFATYFFLADGAGIWAWIVRIAPKAAREAVDSSGRVAWISLTQFVRATVIVAAVDAIGIMIVAAILRVPFVAAIGVLVFLGAFVPLIGATVAGSVAVLVALVDHGFVTALLMLAGVILVQQLEAHGLQPFLLGRWVSVHPLGVIIAIAVGVLVAGVAGALVAVPLAAALNAVVQHLASGGGPVTEEEKDQIEGDLIDSSGPQDEAGVNSHDPAD
ncbi:AI-2E family transporter [Nocardioides sp. Kera G14]|uniref:AI-2E family transporter n=1 Tax=Nocardioides sp. Kera G14 TaxID=2884264 RepID=UPI001D11F084|nr:AI-2E family transporter [Nocardioides sp. Kera G14]UDY22964.1 AI-2E family transporter [Nocardioides sp. Kera G14]